MIEKAGKILVLERNRFASGLGHNRQNRPSVSIIFPKREKKNSLLSAEIQKTQKL